MDSGAPGRRGPSALFGSYVDPYAEPVHDGRQRRGIELDAVRCLALLDEVSVGRIGASIEALPVVLPIHFARIESSVVFGTVRGTKFDVATAGTVVAFEADALDASGAGWMVHLQGVAAPIDDRWRHAHSHSISTILGDRDDLRLVGINASAVTGQRFDPRSDPHRGPLRVSPLDRHAPGPDRPPTWRRRAGYPAIPADEA
jgi:uncharacterized protein